MQARQIAREYPGQLDPAAFEFLQASEVSEQHDFDENVQALAVSPDGSRLAAGFYDGLAKVWPSAGGPPISFVGAPREGGPVRAVGFVKNGNWLATGNNDGSLDIWRLDGTLLRRFDAHAGTIWGVGGWS